MKILLIIILSSLSTFVLTTYYFFSNNFINVNIGERIYFQTQNGNFEFEAIPSKGRDAEMMERLFTEFKRQHKLTGDSTIYRTTPINYFNVRKWCEYKVRSEWQYPYLKK
jgi:hypothetical protein